MLFAASSSLRLHSASVPGTMDGFSRRALLAQRSPSTQRFRVLPSTMNELSAADSGSQTMQDEKAQTSLELSVLDIARNTLLEDLRPLRMGFHSTSQQRRDTIAKLETFVSQYGKFPEAQLGKLDGQWKLLFSDAPDILGIRGGPLSELMFIGQDVDEEKGTCDNVIRYRPSDQAQALFRALGQDISEDRLEQRVLLSFEQDSSNGYPKKVKQTLLGTKIIPVQLLGGRISNTWAPDLGGTGLLTLPFGSYEVLYNDDRLRIVRTQQGFFSVNERILGERTSIQNGIFMPSSESVVGKTILITGGNSGLGLESGKRLAHAGANVVLTVRSHEKVASTLNKVKSAAPEANVSVLLLDLASLDSIQSFPSRYAEEVGHPLDVLIANAGVMAIPERRTTTDGFERQVGVNHLGHFALVSAMLPALKNATNGFRVISVSSSGHQLANEASMKKALDSNLDPSDYTPWGNYGISKAANVLFTKELQDRFVEAGLHASAVCLHPGVVNTELGRYQFQDVDAAVSGEEQIAQTNPVQKAAQQGLSIFTLPPEKGANTQIFLAAAADSDGDLSQNGGKYFDDMKQSTPAAFTTSKDLALRLWEVSEKLTGAKMHI